MHAEVRISAYRWARRCCFTNPAFKTCQDYFLVWGFWHFKQERNKRPSWSSFGAELFISLRRRPCCCCCCCCISLLLQQFDTVFSVTRATNEQVCRLCAIRHPEKIAARTLRSKRLHSADTSVPATPQNEQQQQQQQKFPQKIEGRKKKWKLVVSAKDRRKGKIDLRHLDS